MSPDMRKRSLEWLHEVHNVCDPAGRWRRFVDSIDGRHLSYDPNLSQDEKKELFKNSVDLVEFEPHAYCNRRCPFCPNVFLDRINDKSPMDIDTYRHCIADLEEIGYDKTVRFARYCEPLACKDIVEYVAIARQALPQAEIDIVTNGDYLNAELLAALAEAGLTTLRISIYPKGYVWNIVHAEEQLHKVCINAGVEAKLAYSGGDQVVWNIPHPVIKIVAQALDLETTGYDRGKTLDDLTDHHYRRKTPCLQVFSNVTIDFDRSVMPCCNLRSDMEEHREYIVDRVDGEKSLFDIYASKELTEWRQSLVQVDGKKSPCDTCKQGAVNARTSNFLLKQQIESKLRQIGWHEPRV